MKETKGNLIIHYKRQDSNYKDWSIWLWEFPHGVGDEYHFVNEDSFGAVAIIPFSTWPNFSFYYNMGLIIRSKRSLDKKDCGDRIIKFYKMTPDNEGNYHVFVLQDDPELYANEKLERIATFVYARFIDFKSFEVKTFDLIDEYNIKINGEVVINKKLETPVNEFVEYFKDEISLNNEYIVEVKILKNGNYTHRRIRFAPLYKSKRFEKLFNYDGELGAICKDNETTFKVWSPVSRKILLRIYKKGTPTLFDEHKGNDEIFMEKEMVKGKDGVFSLVIPKNLHGFYYTYVVTNDAYKNREIVDIYAKSTGINGLRGMVIDFNKVGGDDLTKIEIFPYKATSLTPYEVHVADISSSKTWSNKKEDLKIAKTFLAACKEGTTYSENGRTVKTGFDHIKELGVNAVQFLPIFDQSNNEAKMSFNWGYNPANYNTLEGGYSTDPYHGEVRIKEFKHLVKTYHDAGINIIMDVVYNHLYGAVGSNFDVLMPGYYFRYTNEGQYSNGSGCGNETASEMPMYRKFIIDSVLFWAKEYKLGGFRFDLMALHDLETMNELAKTLHSYNKNIIIYGEPWAGGGTMLPGEVMAAKHNATKFKGYGFFNDTTRDAILRTNKNINKAGWALNSFSECREDQYHVVEGIKGITCGVNDPSKVVNYVSCHDNRTISDRIAYNGVTNDKELKRAAMLANSIVLTSNGISFILSGEEFLRSKKGSDNSYNASYEINELDYSLKIKNYDVFSNYKKLIQLKHKVSSLSLDKGDNERLEVNFELPNLITYSLIDKENKREYKVFHVNGLRTRKPLIFDLYGYELYCDTINAHKELSKSTALIPFETLICYKDLK